MFDGDASELSWFYGDPFFVWIIKLVVFEFFGWVFDAVAEGDFEEPCVSAGDGHGVGEVGASFGLVVDFPLHDVRSAGGAGL